ncbi:hypothetical protein [Micromonospora sp. ATCC 39149]|uniref:hypothetical protein n=1 Tax=Micromonospora sp. (strain ATCC 39149 / NRRL 15099 / SCC 1413) TaxID=219305 RepID=UPI0002DA3D3A|nr:hypothetical protein [Micromonospora sp. ATCC 39149]
MTPRRLLVALAAALVAGVAGMLGIAAAADAWTRDGALVLVALAAVWLPCTLTVALVTTRSAR